MVGFLLLLLLCGIISLGFFLWGFCCCGGLCCCLWDFWCCFICLFLFLIAGRNCAALGIFCVYQSSPSFPFPFDFVFSIFLKVNRFSDTIAAQGNIRRVAFGGTNCWNTADFSNIWNVCCSLGWIYSIFIWFYFIPCAFIIFESLQQRQLNKSHLPLKLVRCQTVFYGKWIFQGS